MSADRPADRATEGTGVLLVEDDQNIVDLVRSNLMARGHHVSVSKDGSDAVALLEQQSTGFRRVERAAGAPRREPAKAADRSADSRGKGCRAEAREGGGGAQERLRISWAVRARGGDGSGGRR